MLPGLDKFYTWTNGKRYQTIAIHIFLSVVYNWISISKLLSKPNSPVKRSQICRKIIEEKGASKILNRSKLIFSDKMWNQLMCLSKLLHFRGFWRNLYTFLTYFCHRTVAQWVSEIGNALIFRRTGLLSDCDWLISIDID